MTVKEIILDVFERREDDDLIYGLQDIKLSDAQRSEFEEVIEHTIDMFLERNNLVEE